MSGANKYQNTLKKSAWLGGNVLLPLYETRTVLRALKYAGSQKVNQVKQLRRTRKDEARVEYSFEEAVAASGRSREALMQRYRFGKRLWLTLCLLCLLITLALFASVVINAISLTESGWWRTLSMLFALSGFSTLLFTGALKNQYRLWQLQTRQLGTFQAWRADTAWFRSIFHW